MAPSLTVEALKSWLEAYGRAWETQDPELAASLFRADATYHEVPFDEPMLGRDAIRAYWQEGADAQEQITFGSEVIVAHADAGVARWWASFVRRASGNRVQLDGVFILRFDADGRCSSLREWWHRREEPLA